MVKWFERYIIDRRRWMVSNIDLIKKLCAERKIELTIHVLKRCRQREIAIEDVMACILNGEIIEDYPDDYPFPSCLILGMSIAKQDLHVVVGCDGEKIYLVTAYYPNEEKWQPNHRDRKE